MFWRRGVNCVSTAKGGNNGDLPTSGVDDGVFKFTAAVAEDFVLMTAAATVHTFPTTATTVYTIPTAAATIIAFAASATIIALAAATVTVFVLPACASGGSIRSAFGGGVVVVATVPSMVVLASMRKCTKHIDQAYHNDVYQDVVTLAKVVGVCDGNIELWSVFILLFAFSVTQYSCIS